MSEERLIPGIPAGALTPIETAVEIVPDRAFEALENESETQDSPRDWAGLVARLTPDAALVCGDKLCWAKIANVQQAETFTLDFVYFPPGWTPRGNHWQLSSRALERAKHRQKLRRAPKNQGMRGNDVLPSRFDTLPITADSPSCGKPNLITRAVSGV